MDGQKERKKFSVVASDYKLLEEVGQGVSATVYRAIWLPSNEVVAIKSLDLEKCISNLDGIRREAQMMSLISHPNVVKAYCSFVVDQNLWVVMPYMAGGSCLHIMKSAYPDGFEEPVIATFLKETLKALEYLHRHGHIHRDVKAGNILVDENGTVKLGDFGVSACMFDTGDRQRSRNTFVGTPCWMAPEVMEQLHGYDFKADIWSFGITALELAHGHAPFSKYPPMKVLLMTLQNAPPGLDYERDKRFSRSFREMIAMCLVKDPAKRPSAEKLLKHSFFKQARTYEYIARHVLDGLPPLGERVMNLKLKDAARLAQKKVPYGEQEERSQNEYKRGMSSWNFNVEDLKAQAAMNQGDDYNAGGKEENEVSKVSRPENGTDQPVATSAPGGDGDLERPHLPPTSQPVKAESTADVGNRVLRPRSGPLSSSESSTEAAADRTPKARSGPLSSAGQPLKGETTVADTAVERHPRPRGAPTSTLIHSKSTNGVKGRFDVFGEDIDLGSSHDSFKVSDQVLSDEKDLGRRDRGDSRRSDDEDGWDEKDRRRLEDREPDRGSRGEPERSNREEHSRRLVGGTVGSERNLCKMGDEDKDRDHHRQAFRSSDDLHWAHAQFRDRGLNGAIAGNKELLEEKLLKAGIVQKKGRFSITSEDVDAADVVSHSSGTPQSFASPIFAATVPVAAIYPHLQSVLHHCAAQQEVILHLMNSLSPGELSTSLILSHASSKSFARSASVVSTGDHMMDAATEKEREHLHQITEFRSKVAHLVDELQAAKLKNIHLVDEMQELKLRNVQLEQQLKAVYKKEEEERIRKGSAAKEDG